MVTNIGTSVKFIVAAAGAAVLAGCATAPPSAPPPAPMAVVKQEVIPYRPLPPGGASFVMDIPRKGADGIRRTVNTGLSDDEVVWHFRSAWNVAALNCPRAQHQRVVDAYSAYITDHSRALRRVNNRIEQTYLNAAKSRRDAIRTREQTTTSVYNFFALPPARGSFCRNALDISNRALASRVSDPVTFARENFALLTSPFDEFFEAYEEYERSSAAWDARWGAKHGHTQPGYVAVQAARQRGELPASYAPSNTLAQGPVVGSLVAAQPGGEHTTALSAPAVGPEAN